MTRSKINCACRRGSALVLSLLFLAVLSALAVAMATISGANVQVAHNQRQGGWALASAHSDIEVLRYYLKDVSIAAGAPAGRLEALFHQLEEQFADASNLSISYSGNAVTLDSVVLSLTTNQSFDATVTYGSHADGTPDYDAIDVTVTGSSGQAAKRVGFTCLFKETGNPIFDYGIATRGPLMTQGNVDIETFNEAFWADIYIESLNSNLALEMIGKSSVAGKVTIANSTANVDIANSSSVFGAKGSDAIEFITIGADACTFPVPNPSEFLGYVTTVFQTGDPTSNTTLTNVEIPADTNPQFTGNTTINGVMYIRQPNTVRFVGNATINGVIAASGVQFYGHAGGTINGSIINYSDDRMELAGNTDLVFNRSGRDKILSHRQPWSSCPAATTSTCDRLQVAPQPRRPAARWRDAAWSVHTICPNTPTTRRIRLRPALLHLARAALVSIVKMDHRSAATSSQ